VLAGTTAVEAILPRRAAALARLLDQRAPHRRVMFAMLRDGTYYQGKTPAAA
jgi:hypothetical protein